MRIATTTAATLTFAAVACASLPSVRGEGGGVEMVPSCGSPPLAKTAVRVAEPYLTRPEHVMMRDSLIVRQSASAARSVVTDSASCQTALDATLAILQAGDQRWPELQQYGYEHAVTVFGPYTLVVIRPDEDASALSRSEFIPCFVYRTSDMRLLAVWMI